MAIAEPPGFGSGNQSTVVHTMNIVESYSRQYRWRAWPIILDALPDLDGQRVLDLGCGIGDLAADISARGAHVIGLDINSELVAFASARNIPNAEFRVADLRRLHEPSLRVDGIWSSFTAAYFTSLHDTLASWLDHLRPGGWLALTEIDDLFGHQPVSDRTSELLSGYVLDALEHARYDFRMGRKMADILSQLGLTVVQELALPDSELSFSGPAAPDVVDAWRRRLDGMHLLWSYCGSEFESVRDDFLNCLSRSDHVCSATVRCCIAEKARLQQSG